MCIYFTSSCFDVYKLYVYKLCLFRGELESLNTRLTESVNENKRISADAATELKNMAANHEAARIQDANKVMTLTETLEKELTSLRNDKTRLTNELEQVKSEFETHQLSSSFAPPTYDTTTTNSLSEDRHKELLETARQEAKELALVEYKNSQNEENMIVSKLQDEIDTLKIKLQQTENKATNLSLAMGGNNGAAAAAEEEECPIREDLGVWYEEKFSPEKNKFYYQKKDSDKKFWLLPPRENGTIHININNILREKKGNFTSERVYRRLFFMIKVSLFMIVVQHINFIVFNIYSGCE